MSVSFEERLAAGDLTLFKVASQTTANDQASLLLVQSLVRNIFGRYAYFEVGSHLGGTLVPHLLDPLCSCVVSIDKRPLSQPDERGILFDYENNSTARMIETLSRHVPDSHLLKLLTIDCDASAVTSEHMPQPPDLVLIDAEHTNIAVVSDFLSLSKLSHADTVFAFHDSNLISDALVNITAFLCHMGDPAQLLFLPDQVGVILRGKAARFAPALSRHAVSADAFLPRAKEQLQRVIAENLAKREAGITSVALV